MAAGVWLACACAATPVRTQAAEVVEAVTGPSKDVVRSFLLPGLIHRVLVKEGDWVKPGQVLVRLDESVDRIELDALRNQAEDMVQIDAAEAQMAHSKVEWDILKDAQRKNAAPAMEVRKAELTYDISKLKLALARFQITQDNLKYQQKRIRVEQMRMVSKIAGKVEGIAVEEGETVEQLANVLHIIVIDPLWVDAKVPLDTAWRLRLGRQARVILPGYEGKPAKTVTGKVIHVSSVAAIGKVTVRVEVPNPTRRPAGERVHVSFPPATKEANATRGPRKAAVAELAIRSRTSGVSAMGRPAKRRAQATTRPARAGRSKAGKSPENQTERK